MAEKKKWLQSFAVLLMLVFVGAGTIHGQVGPGVAPPLLAQPDKFPSLTWTASTSSGVTYNVYRGAVAGGPKGRVNTVPVAPTNFRDASAAFGVQNFYTVTAQRTSDGVESVQSNETSATAVQGSPAPPTQLNAMLVVLLKVGKAIYAGLKHFAGFFA